MGDQDLEMLLEKRKELNKAIRQLPEYSARLDALTAYKDTTEYLQYVDANQTLNEMPEVKEKKELNNLIKAVKTLQKK